MNGPEETIEHLDQRWQEARAKFLTYMRPPVHVDWVSLDAQAFKEKAEFLLSIYGEVISAVSRAYDEETTALRRALFLADVYLVASREGLDAAILWRLQRD